MKIGDCEQGKIFQLRKIAYAFFVYVLRGVWKLLRFSSERKQHAARTVTAVQFGDLSGVCRQNDRERCPLVRIVNMGSSEAPKSVSRMGSCFQ